MGVGVEDPLISDVGVDIVLPEGEKKVAGVEEVEVIVEIEEEDKEVTVGIKEEEKEEALVLPVVVDPVLAQDLVLLLIQNETNSNSK